MTIVAEIGTAHGGSSAKAEKLVDAAVEAGADAVKFQWVYADEILHPDTGFVTLPGGKTRLYDRFRELEAPPSFYRHMADYSRQKGVKFFCSPFGLRSLQELTAIHPDAVKIASPELNHIPLLKELAHYRCENDLPVIISTGVSKLADIEAALSLLGTKNVTMLHCITMYPAPETEYNLRLIKTLAAVFGVQTGVSDHSLDPILVPVLSAAMGGQMVEKHITLSKTDTGLDDPVALEPEQFAHMCYCLHQAEAAIRRYSCTCGGDQIIEQMEDQFGKEKVAAVLGNGVKKLAPSEYANYGRTNRSLHFMHDMKKGDAVHEEDIGVLRTEKILTPGISPSYLETVTNGILSTDVTAGKGVQWEDFIAKN